MVLVLLACAGGAPGTPTVVTQFETGSAPDGVAVDAAGGV